MCFHEWHYKNMSTVDLHIEGMTCSACSSRIERVLSRLPGVTAEVSLLEHRARITGLSPDDAIAAVRRAGYDARPLGPSHTSPRRRIGPHPSDQDQTPRGIEAFRLIFSLAALAVMLIEMAVMLSGQPGWVPTPVQFVLALVMQTVVAWPFYQSALRAARGGSANMETLISIGSLAAFFGSVWVMTGGMGQAQSHGALYFETSVIVIAMVRIGKALEQRARGQALSAIEKLTRLDTAEIAVREPETGQWVQMPPESIGQGRQIRLAPNQPISLDAVITEGDTEVDESSMTGESMPVVKHVGDAIYAGCTNLTGTITATVSCDFSQSRRAQLGEKMLSALASRAPIGALADRIAAGFVPAVLVLAALTFLGHLFFERPTSIAISNAIAVLVVACPCALGLATPAAIAAGLARAAQMGWFFQNARALQQASRIHRVVFDKTGTLTSGRPFLIGFMDSESETLLALETQEKPWPGWLAAACAAEQGIEHPLAGGLLSYAAGRPMPSCSDVLYIAGGGVSARLESGPFMGKLIRVGNSSWISPSTTPQSVLDRHTDVSAVDVAIDGHWVGRIWMSDRPRHDAADGLASLERMGIQVSIMSGDREAAVERIARSLGGIEFLAQLGPEEKADRLDAWQKSGAGVAMVGDGLNDASAMAHADLGIAMASGATLTVKSADLTLSTATPIRDCAASLALAKDVLRRVKENLAFAFIFNVAAIPMAALGMLSPVIAGSAMALSSAAVISNAVRLLRWKRPAFISRSGAGVTDD